MRSRFIFLSILTCVAMLVAGVAPGIGAPGDSSDPAVAVPDVETQFGNLQLHGDPVGFRVGVGDDPSNCRHYQGIARVNAPDGTPYLILSRSGTDAGIHCLPDGDRVGELVVVKMGTRDLDGERLRSNLLVSGQDIEDTAPRPDDEIVYHVQLDGNNGWPAYSHPGGMQAVGDVVVIALSDHCPDGYNSNPDPDERTCKGDLASKGGFLLVKVDFTEDPDNPSEYSVGLTPSKTIDTHTIGDSEIPYTGIAGTVGVALVPSGCPDQADADRYLFAVGMGGSAVNFYWTDSDNLATVKEVTAAGSWSSDALGVWSEMWRPWEMVNLVRDDVGGLYLIGAENTGPLLVGDDWIGLFKVDPSKVSITDGCTNDAAHAITEMPIQKHLQLESGFLGNLDAASGTYVSPSGQLILYAAEHDNDGPGGSIRAGEFRNIDVYHEGTTATERMCPWVELYEDETGWDDDSPDRSLMLDFKDRHLEDWPNLHDEDFGDETDSLRWYLEPGQKMWLFKDDAFSGTALEIVGVGAVLYWPELDGLGYGDNISSVWMSGVADPGGPYSGTVDVPLTLDFANPCYRDGEAATFSWTVDSSACSFSDPTARQPAITCGTESTFNVEVTITEYLDVVKANTTVTMVAPPPDPDPDPDPGPDPFTDDDDSVFEADIEWLAAAGITRGCNPPVNDMFCPDQAVTRGQMAAFLVRAMGYTDDGGGDLFGDDDGSVFESDIDKLGTAGITRGCNPPVNDMFCPDQAVTRGQMAAFLHRALS